VGLEQGQLSLVSTTEELPLSKNSGSGLETENTAIGIHFADYMAPSIHKTWYRQTVVTRYSLLAD
jgi:hypothetical protein